MTQSLKVKPQVKLGLTIQGLPWPPVWYIKDALVYQILLIVFTDIDAYDYVRQKKGMQDGQAVFFSIHK